MTIITKEGKHFVSTLTAEEIRIVATLHARRLFQGAGLQGGIGCHPKDGSTDVVVIKVADIDFDATLARCQEIPVIEDSLPLEMGT